MKKNKRKNSRSSKGRHERKEKFPLRKILGNIVEWIELIFLSIIFAVMGIFSIIFSTLLKLFKFLWKYKVHIFKYVFVLFIVINFVLFANVILQISGNLQELNQKVDQTVNELNIKNEENKNLQDQINTTNTELESTKQELEMTKQEYENLKLSKAKEKQEKERKLAEEKRLKEEQQKQSKLASAQVTSRGGSERHSSNSSYQDYAHDLCINTYGWSEHDFDCLVKLWNKESGWNPNVRNPSSSAAGIPQFLSSTVNSYSNNSYYSDWSEQVRAGLKYIKSRYGSPSSAWNYWSSYHWY